MLKYVLSIMLVLVSVDSFSVEFTGTVKGFYVNSANTALVTLKQEELTPSCLPGTWQFHFDSTTEYGKQWVSMILASRMSQTKIKVGYTPNPYGRCSVSYFYYLDNN